MFDKIFGRGRPIRNRVIFHGVHKDQPAFEFQGEGPPDWLLKALRTKVIRVEDGVCRVRDEVLEYGSTLHRKAVA